MNYGNLQRDWGLSDSITLGGGKALGATLGNWVGFKRRASAVTRKPCAEVVCERLGSVSGSVIKAWFKRRIEDRLREHNHGQGGVTLQDDDGSLISSGRCVIRVGDKVKWWAGFDGDVVPRFTGSVYNAQVSSATHTVSLRLADGGRRLKRAMTYGDYSDYNTPKLLIDRLLERAYCGVAEYENGDGLLSSHEFAMTDLRRRSYWAIMHGALLAPFYTFYFDADGIMQVKRRDNFFDTDICLTDNEIKTFGRVRMSRLINHMSLPHDNAVPFSHFALNDVRWGQSRLTMTDELSKRRYGEEASGETDELIEGLWLAVYLFIKQSLVYYSHPRTLYQVSTPALPQLQIMDRISIRSKGRNISGKFIIMEIEERYSPGKYDQSLMLLSERERF